MPGPKENKASEVGMATRGGGHAESVKGIEGEHGRRRRERLAGWSGVQDPELHRSLVRENS